MIVCLNCNHQNPEGAVQCESCYTPLQAADLSICPRCHAPIQPDAKFCGQCGFNLNVEPPAEIEATDIKALVPPSSPPLPPIPDLVAFDSPATPEPLESPLLDEQTDFVAPFGSPASPAAVSPTPMHLPATVASPPTVAAPADNMATTPLVMAPLTQLQVQVAELLHMQSNVALEIPQHLPIVHIGKPNERVPPDIDVSGFAHSDIVSRSHADIRHEGDAYYIEDVGSSNGTYINNILLPVGNRHRLRTGDRISLGKGDLVTFMFKLV
jgi:ribosomal protein L40E